MFVLKLDAFAARRQNETNEILSAARAIQAEKDSRQAAQYLMDQVGIEAIPLYNEAYYRNVVDYLCAQLLSRVGRALEASDLLARAIPTGSPEDWECLQFEDYVRFSTQGFERQSEAVARGIPAFPIISLPKSGSASLSRSIASAFSIPVLRFSTGQAPHMSIVPHYLGRFMRGGCVSHDHCDASPENLACLETQGVKDVFIQVRDPRAAANSMFQFMQKCGIDDTERQALADRFLELVKVNADWVAGWAGYHVSVERRLNTHFIFFNDVKTDLTNLVDRITAQLPMDAEQRAVCSACLKARASSVTANYVVGDDNAWRERVSEDLARRAWNVMQPLTKELFGLER